MALEPITRQEQIIAGKDLEPITRMEKFLKEYGGGGDGNHAPADWNAKAGEPGHVLNRTHWVEDRIGEVLPECQLIPGDEAFSYPITPELINGEKYTVVWNGVGYECTALKIEGTFALGNLGVMDESLEATEDPFVVLIIPGYMLQAMPLDGSTSVTLAIRGVIETVHKLAEKFVPNYYTKIVNVEADIQNDVVTPTSADVSYSDLKKYVNENRRLVVWLHIKDSTSDVDIKRDFYLASGFSNEIVFTTISGASVETSGAVKMWFLYVNEFDLWKLRIISIA